MSVTMVILSGGLLVHAISLSPSLRMSETTKIGDCFGEADKSTRYLLPNFGTEII